MTAVVTDPRAAPMPSLRAPAQGVAFDKLSWLTVLYLLCVVVPLSANLGGLYMTTLRLLLLIVTLPMLVGLLCGRYGPRLATDWLFLGHAIWLTIALAVNNPDRVIQQAPSVGVEFLGGYVLARATIRSRAQFIAMCKLIIAIVLILLPFALMEARTGNPTILQLIRAIPGITSVEVVTNEGRLGLERVQSVFAHPIHFGLFCSVAFSLAFVALRDVSTVTHRFVTAGLVGLAGFLALSSGALLAIALQVALIAWAFTFRGVRNRWWILVGLFAIMWVGIDLLSNRGPIEVFMSYATFSAHNAYWRSIIFEWGVMNILGSAENDIPASPWFGIGLNDWIRPHYMYSGSMDNFWLVMGVRYGLPGFGLIALGFAAQLYRLIRLDIPDGDPLLYIRRACVFTFLGLSFTLATVHVWGNLFSFVMFFVGATGWLVQPGTAAPPADDTPPPDTRRTPGYSRFGPRTSGAPLPYARQSR